MAKHYDQIATTHRHMQTSHKFALKNNKKSHKKKLSSQIIKNKKDQPDELQIDKTNLTRKLQQTGVTISHWNATQKKQENHPEQEQDKQAMENYVRQNRLAYDPDTVAKQYSASLSKES